MSIADLSHPVTMGSDDLDETAIGRRIERLTDTVEKNRNLPPWVLPLVLYLIGQLIGGVWWGATMQAKMDFLVIKNAEMQQKIEVHDLLINKAENGLDEHIRTKTREVLTDWGYIHIPRKGD